jgi:multiple sugar transport system permease protein
VALFLAVLILFAFIYLPWLWEEAKYNGARLMTDVLMGGNFKNFASTNLVIIPIASMVAASFAIWGLITPQRGGVACFMSFLAGVVGLYYFVDVYLIQEGEVAEYIRDSLGNGFYVALVAMLGLVAQVVFMVPAVNNGLNSAGSQAGSLVPSLPRKYVPYAFLIVPLALYLVWIIGPTIYTFYLSLTNWDGVTAPEYIGVRHYENLLDDNAFKEALGNNARWLVIFITVPTTMGLALAMIFNTEMRGGRWYKVSFYSPLILSWPVIGLVWSWLYHPRRGLINSLLLDSGLTDSAPGWLADRDIAIYCIIAAAVWRQVGYVMVLYLAGLKNIDPSYIDAALVDGANRWQLFRKVIFPLLAPVTTIIFVISIIDSLRAFDLVQVITRGNTGTQVLANLMYMESFNNYRMGYGGAIAVVLFSIAIFFVGIYLWITLKDELEY